MAGFRIHTPSGVAKDFLESVVLQYEGNECLVWPYRREKNGYGSIRKNGKNYFVHRVICEEAEGPPPSPAHQAAHSCGNGKGGGVTKRHLSWKTPKENNADKIIHGTDNRGEKHNLAKLSEIDARKILSLKGEEPMRDTAERFGVSISAISRIRSGKAWACIREGGV